MQIIAIIIPAILTYFTFWFSTWLIYRLSPKEFWEMVFTYDYKSLAMFATSYLLLIMIGWMYICVEITKWCLN